MLTQNEIWSGSEIIAEFVGATKRTNSLWDFKNTEYASMTQPHIRVTDMEFHTSWNWIMPVCYMLDRFFPDPFLLTREQECEFSKWCEELDDAVTLYEKDTIFLTVVGYIKWIKVNGYKNQNL